MADMLEIKVADKILAVNPMRTHSRNLSWGGQGTPLGRKLSASPKVVSALASMNSIHSHRRSGSFKDIDADVPVEFRIARHASANLSMELFRVPEDKMQQNIDFLEKIIERTPNDTEIASAVAEILPTEHIEIPQPGTPRQEEYLPLVIAHSSSVFGLEQAGEAGTFDYRLYMTRDEKRAAFWHDIPLENGDGTVNFVCEIPKDTKAKMEVATGEEQTPIKQDIKKGKLREYPYNINWNYGMLPRTWENPEVKHEELGGIAGDNDPVDVVEIGSEQLQSGGVYKVKVLGAYAMIDEGELDWKIIAIRTDDPMADYLNDIDDVERRLEGTLEKIMVWFRDYKMPDGKPANRFGYDNQPQKRDLAEKVIQETHEYYQDMMASKCQQYLSNATLRPEHS